MSCIKKNEDISQTSKEQVLYSSNNKNNEILHLELNQIIINQIKSSQSIIVSFEENRDTIFSLLSKNKKNIILYRYSENMCSSCIQEDLSILNEFQKENKSFNVFVTVDFVDKRENYVRFNSELEKFKHLRLDKSFLSLPKNDLLGSECRYFAVIINNEISYIFFPIRGNIKLTKMYFDLIVDLD